MLHMNLSNIVFFNFLTVPHRNSGNSSHPAAGKPPETVKRESIHVILHNGTYFKTIQKKNPGFPNNS